MVWAGPTTPLKLAHLTFQLFDSSLLQGVIYCDVDTEMVEDEIEPLMGLQTD